MDYLKECEKTWQAVPSSGVTHEDMERVHLALALAGEAGEVADLIKKVVFYKKPEDLRSLHAELGDVLYHLTILADRCQTDIETLQRDNIAKLRQRHGESYNPGHYTGGGIANVPGISYDKNGKALHIDKS